MKGSSEFGTEEEAKPPSFPQWSSRSDFFQIHALGHGRPCERLNAKQALPRGNIPRSDRGENGSEGPHDVILSFPLGNANTLKLFSHHESLQKNNLHLRPRKHLSQSNKYARTQWAKEYINCEVPQSRMQWRKLNNSNIPGWANHLTRQTHKPVKRLVFCRATVCVSASTWPWPCPASYSLPADLVSEWQQFVQSFFGVIFELIHIDFFPTNLMGKLSQ